MKSDISEINYDSDEIYTGNWERDSDLSEMNSDIIEMVSDFCESDSDIG